MDAVLAVLASVVVVYVVLGLFMDGNPRFVELRRESIPGTVEAFSVKWLGWWRWHRATFAMIEGRVLTVRNIETGEPMPYCVAEAVETFQWKERREADRKQWLAELREAETEARNAILDETLSKIGGGK